MAVQNVKHHIQSTCDREYFVFHGAEKKTCSVRTPKALDKLSRYRSSKIKIVVMSMMLRMNAVIC